MVVKLPFIPQYGMVGMVELQQMLQCSGWLLMSRIGLMNLDRWKIEYSPIPP